MHRRAAPHALGVRVVALALALLSCRTRPEPPSPDAATGAASPDASGRASPLGARPANERQSELDALVREVARDAEIHDRRVLDALRRVARHRFVPPDVAHAAYQDRPLPIGHDQTISQPAVVAVMTAAVRPSASDRCLEIGTGSGYQAAVLAEVCRKVYSIEYLAPLARVAEKNLRGSGYGPERVALRTGDGYDGWPEAAPFDAIVVTAAPEQVPRPLLEQLAFGGRLVIPVGPEHEVQRLELYERKGPGLGPDAFDSTILMAVRFVPFLGPATKAR
jgi:protein-L-isoaspartate(D-aspartate) O-methyltransferase